MQHWRCLRNWRMRDLIISLRQRYGFLISWVRDHINFTGLISNQWPGPSHCTGHHCHRGPLPLHSRTQARPGSRRGRHAAPRLRARHSHPRHTRTGPQGCSTAGSCSFHPHTFLRYFVPPLGTCSTQIMLFVLQLNQDILENIFGVIRAMGGSWNNPDFSQFSDRLRIVSMTR